MIDWNDAQKLHPGQVLYEEKWKGSYVYFLPMRVTEVSEEGITVVGSHISLWIPKGSFPYDNLYLGEDGD